MHPALLHPAAALVCRRSLLPCSSGSRSTTASSSPTPPWTQTPSSSPWTQTPSSSSRCRPKLELLFLRPRMTTTRCCSALLHDKLPCRRRRAGRAPAPARPRQRKPRVQKDDDASSTAAARDAAGESGRSTGRCCCWG
jgi:hypothetical protein